MKTIVDRVNVRKIWGVSLRLIIVAESRAQVWSSHMGINLKLAIPPTLAQACILPWACFEGCVDFDIFFSTPQSVLKITNYDRRLDDDRQNVHSYSSIFYILFF